MKLFSNPKHLLKEWFPDRISVLYFVFAVVVALVYWTVTVTEEKETKTFPVQVRFTNIPRGYAVIGPDAHAKINIEVAGLSDILKKIGAEEIELSIDAEKFISGPFVYELTENDVSLPSSVSFLRVFPKILQLQLDKRISAKIALKPQFVGKADGGKQVVSWKVEPPAIEAEGPQSVLEATKYIPTQPIPLNGRREDFSIPVVPINDDPEVSVNVEVQPILKVVMGDRREQKVIKGIPVVVAKLPAHLEARTEPREILVVIEGSPQAVQKVLQENLFAQIDVSALSASETPFKLKPAIQFRDGVKNGCEVSSFSPPFVEVFLKERR